MTRLPRNIVSAARRQLAYDAARERDCRPLDNAVAVCIGVCIGVVSAAAIGGLMT